MNLETKIVKKANKIETLQESIETYVYS